MKISQYVIFLERNQVNIIKFHVGRHWSPPCLWIDPPPPLKPGPGVLGFSLRRWNVAFSSTLILIQYSLSSTIRAAKTEVTKYRNHQSCIFSPIMPSSVYILEKVFRGRFEKEEKYDKEEEKKGKIQNRKTCQLWAEKWKLEEYNKC